MNGEVTQKWISYLKLDEVSMNDGVIWIYLLSLLVLSIIAYIISLLVLKKIVLRVAQKTSNTYDDDFYDSKVLHKLVYLIPLVMIDYGLKVILHAHSSLMGFINNIIESTYILVFLGVIYSLLNFWICVHTKVYQGGRSIKSLVQAVKIVVTLVGMIIIISILFHVNAGVILTAIGTASAVLLLVFRDSILGFVGSIQLATNKMVLLGDWIEMPQYSADGVVTDISLVAVKVRNWDNTDTTIPTYALVTNSVKNWRSMSESGRRRIKRCLFMDMASVKFLDRELFDRLRKVDAIKDYLEHTDEELEAHNKQNMIDDSVILNGQHQTNLGIFRAYIVHYLKNHPNIDHISSTFLVRQLQPTDMGIPLEIYVFTNTSVWVEYENIQADIFDHILASVEYFDLHVYQRPSWFDYKTS